MTYENDNEGDSTYYTSSFSTVCDPQLETLQLTLR